MTVFLQSFLLTPPMMTLTTLTTSTKIPATTSFSPLVLYISICMGVRDLPVDGLDLEIDVEVEG